ncbi:MAG: response regulator [Christensenella sp.]
MKRKSGREVKNIGVLLVAVVIIISVGVSAFVGITIVNTNNLAAYTNEIYTRPYATNNAAWKMRMRILLARNTMLELLIGSEHGENQDEKLQQLQRMRENTPQLETELRSQYSGQSETAELLIAKYEELQKLHDRCIGLINQGNRREAEELLYHIAPPIYNEAEAYINQIINFSQQSIDEYVNRAYALNDATNQLALVGGIILILLTVGVSVAFMHAIKRKNADIIHSNALFRIIAESVDDVFMVYDRTTERVEFVSDNIEQMLGVDADACKRNMWIARAYLDDETFQRLSSIFRSPHAEEVCSYEFVMTDPKTGSRKELASKRYPIIKDNKVIKFVYVTQDLTETKTVEHMLRTALMRAENANTAKREFLSRMSHEIRTPMNAISGTLRSLEYFVDDTEKARAYINKIQLSMNHLLELIGDILDMSKIESGKLTLDIKEFDLQEMIRDVAAIMQPKAEENRQIFDVVFKNITCDMLSGDELRIKQVLLNFLSNALKFTPEHGKIRVTVEETERKGNMVCIKFEVKDTGIGMQAEFLKRIFEPFEQAESTTYRKYGGTGLGMPLSKAMVESMGGKIEIASEPEMGSIFSFRLWLSCDGISEIRTARNVLIVEDNAEQRGNLELLCRRLGVNVSIAVSGVEAAKMLEEKETDFDLCFIDLYMPDMDGIRTAEWIRSKIGEDVYIVLMSEYEYKNIEQEARLAGVNDFLTKPISKEGVERVVQKAFGIKCALSEKEDYDFRGKRLLIAEDNELNMEVAKEMCERAGFEVVSAYTGKEAVDKFAASAEKYYDAILMDIHMPVMNGNEAAREIRELGRKDSLSVGIFAMTANAFYEDVEEAIKSGMNEHFSKPIEPEIVFAALNRFLGDKNGGGQYEY